MGEKRDEIIVEENISQSSFSPPHAGSEEERLRAEIEETRLQLSRTLDEIKAQLSMDRLRRQAKARVKEASIGRSRRAIKNANSQIRSTFRDHPFMGSLTGLGALWLVVKGIKSARSGDGEFEGVYKEKYPLETRQPETGMHEPSSFRTEEVMGKASEKAEELKGGLESARERVGEAGERARHKVRSYRDRTKERMEQTREKATFQKNRLQDSFKRTFEERPLLVTAVAVAAGAIIASLFPETEKERELMGESKESLTGKLKEKAQESFERAKTVVQEKTEEAKQDIKENV
jgi:hypothetical protein